MAQARQTHSGAEWDQRRPKSPSFSPPCSGVQDLIALKQAYRICFSNPILITVRVPYGSGSESGADSDSDREDSEHQLNMCWSLTRRHRKRAGEGASKFSPSG